MITTDVKTNIRKKKEKIQWLCPNAFIRNNLQNLNTM